MPLEAYAAEDYVDPGCFDVTFSMREMMTDLPIRITVERCAIEKLGFRDMPLDAFASFAPALKGIASRKFDRQGGGTEVSLVSGDLLSGETWSTGRA